MQTTLKATSAMQQQFILCIRTSNGKFVYGLDMISFVFGTVVATIETAVDNNNIVEALQLINALLVTHNVQYVVTHIVKHDEDEELGNLYYVQAL